MLNLGLHGSTGKMGRAIHDVCCDLNTVEISHRYSSQSSPEDLDLMVKHSHIIIDFSSPSIINKLLAKALEYGRPLVIGTTGISEETFEQICISTEQVPIFYSANMSVGVNLLAKAVELVASVLSENDYDVDIFEIHHKHKKDSPSGTALMLGQRIAQVRGRNLSDIKVSDRGGGGCARKVGDLGFSSIRAGGENGFHEVIFSGQYETISFSHRAYSRRLFAESAVKIAMWLVKQPKGLYRMDDYMQSVGLNL